MLLPLLHQMWKQGENQLMNQLAHVLEITLRVDPEKNEPTLIFKPLECFNTYTSLLLLLLHKVPTGELPGQEI